MDEVQLSNAVIDGARAAAICGGQGRDPQTTLPNGSSCSSANLASYVDHRLQAVPVGVNINVTVFLSGNQTSTDLNQCSANRLVEVDASYPQNLYVPLVGTFLGNGAGDTRTITATGKAICTQ